MLSLEGRASASSPHSSASSHLVRRPPLEAQAGVPSATERASVHMAGGASVEVERGSCVQANLGLAFERSTPPARRTDRRPLRGAWRSTASTAESVGCDWPGASDNLPEWCQRQRGSRLAMAGSALLLLSAVAAIAWGMVTLERIHAESHARYLASAPLGGWER